MEERLQKVLASAGVASRREAEKYILAGRVKVNAMTEHELRTLVNVSFSGLGISICCTLSAFLFICSSSNCAFPNCRFTMMSLIR